MIGREKQEPPAVWTPETLRVHIMALLDEKDRRDRALRNEKDLRDQQRFDAQEKALGDALAAVEKSTRADILAQKEATTKAEAAANDRFASVNEFRATLADQAQQFYPRAEAAEALKALAKDVDGLASRLDKRDGRSGGLDAGWVYLLGAFVLASTVVTIIISTR